MPASAAAGASGLKKHAVTAVWFRKSLRLHDNAALVQAASHSEHVVPIFILDPWFASPENVGAVRFNFLLEALRDLDESLQREYGSRLVVLRGEPVATLTEIFTASSSSSSSTSSSSSSSVSSDASAAAAEVLPPCFTCDAVVWEEETVEPYGLRRDSAVLEAARSCGVSAAAVPGGHHLWDPSAGLALLAKNKAPPTTMKGFEALAEKLGVVPAPLPAPASLPPLPKSLVQKLATMTSSAVVIPFSEQLLPPRKLTDLPGFAADPQALRIDSFLSSSSSPGGEVAYGGAPYGLVGGETAALARLEAMIGDPARDKWVAAFEKPKTRSTGFDGGGGKQGAESKLGKGEGVQYGGGSGHGGNGGPSTTLLSPYLKFGCVSARRMHQTLLQSYARSSNHTKPPTSLLGQLYFREMAYLQAKHHGEAFEQAPSPVCAHIPWLPTTATTTTSASTLSPPSPSSSSSSSSSSKQQEDGEDGEEKGELLEGARRLKAWEEGQTGFPYVDACMRQLKETGWLHHLARHSVACFLTRGDLWVSWTDGRDVFDKYLLDADWAVNNFNWLWLAGVAPWSSPYFRVYTPIPDPKTSSLNVLDSEGFFVKRFVPELRHMPAKYIYSPWTAPPNVQANVAKCLVGDTKPPTSLFGTPKAASSSSSSSSSSSLLKPPSSSTAAVNATAYAHYPAPIVDHKEASKENIAKFKAALDANRAAKGAAAATSTTKEPVKKKAKKS